MSIEDFTERRQLRGFVTKAPQITISPFTPDEFRRAERALERWKRHTDEMAPAHVEDEMLAFERGWRRAKVAWAVLFVLVAGYVVWRLVK